MVDTLKISDLTDYGDVPSAEMSFYGLESGADDWQITYPDLVKMQVNDATGFDVNSLILARHFVYFGDATDRLVTLTGTLSYGWEFVAYAGAASGGTGHKILLPLGTYWGYTGTNRAALLNNAGDYLSAIAVSDTRFVPLPTSIGVTYASS